MLAGAVKRHCGKRLLQLGQPMQESGSRSDPDSELRSSCASLSETGRGPH